MKPHAITAALVATLLLSWSLGTRTLRAELEQPQDFDPTDLVESLEFTIHVGEGGEQLAEPVALDLGLGFPFWLHPLGSEQADRLPVGATPQEAPEQSTLQPGASATFVFRREGDSGNDKLRHTPQLLDGVRISDIARLGVISKGATDWELAGYRLVINGKPFATHDDVRQKARTRIQQAQLDWMEARGALEVFAQERSDLTALEEAGLATEEDLARLEEIESKARPLQNREVWQQGVSAGALPWFIEEGLQVPGREEASEIAAGRVILTTAPLTNAETYNYVYFRTGGKKYFLYPAENHFTPDSNPQEFDLLLPAGPLAASDVRGFALGMLAHNRPYAAAPDRWHPQRLVVEFDGRSVYDSEAAAIDRQSLEVIRLIPPAHIDGDGNVQVNEPNPRECYVWTAGQAQGLDLENGGAADVGDGGVAGIEPEPPDSSTDAGGSDSSGSVTSGDGTGDTGTADATDIPGDGDGRWPGETPLDPDPWPGCPPDGFPPDDGGGSGGVAGPPWDGGPGGDGWDPGDGTDGDAPGWPGGFSWWGFGFGPGGFWAGGGSAGGGMPSNGIPPGVLGQLPDPNVDPAAWDAFAAWLTDLVDALLAALGPMPGTTQPIGEPPQVDNVHLLRNADDPSLYQVVWDYSGDTSQIQSCTVALHHIKPETGNLLEKVVATQSDIPVDITVSNWLQPEGPVDVAGYLEPVVTIETQDAQGVPSEPQIAVGPALPWLLPTATAANQPRPVYLRTLFTGGWQHFPITVQEPDTDQPGAWTQKVMPTSSGKLLATEGITSNVAQKGVTQGQVAFVVDEQLDPARQYELIGHVGLLDPLSEEPLTLSVTIAWYVTDGKGGRANYVGSHQQQHLYLLSDSQPQLYRIPVKMDPPRSPGSRTDFDVTFALNCDFGPAGSPQPQLPAIYGLRLIPVEP